VRCNSCRLSSQDSHRLVKINGSFLHTSLLLALKLIRQSTFLRPHTTIHLLVLNFDNAINFSFPHTFLYFSLLDRRLCRPQSRSGLCEEEEILDPTGTRIPARSQSLYRLRYPSCQSRRYILKLRGLSPRANYSDRATAACRRS
jgi:hypothetical protein